MTTVGAVGIVRRNTNATRFHTMKTARRAYTISAVDRACAVLHALAGPQPRSLVEVAERAGLDEATALRYLSSLTQHGFVARHDETRRYSMGLTVFQLGQHAVGGSEVRKVALPHMERLLEEFEETVNLSTSRDERLVVIEVLESTRSIRRGATVGEADVWHASALGKATLAEFPEQDARAVLGALNVRPTPSTRSWTSTISSPISGSPASGAMQSTTRSSSTGCAALPRPCATGGGGRRTR